MKKLKPPFPWVGGKRLLRDHIISLIPDHHTYVEAFAGGAWVYWGKEQSNVEVINDLNGDLINLYEQIQTNPEALYERLWYMLVSREAYYKYLHLLKSENANLSDLDRAVYYFYVIKNAFGGRFGSGFAFSKERPPRSAVQYDKLMELSNRLRQTYIENLPYDRLIKNYDGEKVFFYCDPPYVCADGGNYYQHTFTEEMHRDLHERLSNLKGKFLLSYDDVPFIRELYKDFTIEETKPVLYTLNRNHRYKHELLIRNY